MNSEEDSDSLEFESADEDLLEQEIDLAELGLDDVEPVLLSEAKNVDNEKVQKIAEDEKVDQKMEKLTEEISANEEDQNASEKSSDELRKNSDVASVEINENTLSVQPKLIIVQNDFDEFEERKEKEANKALAGFDEKDIEKDEKNEPCSIEGDDEVNKMLEEMSLNDLIDKIDDSLIKISNNSKIGKSKEEVIEGEPSLKMEKNAFKSGWDDVDFEDIDSELDSDDKAQT